MIADEVNVSDVELTDRRRRGGRRALQLVPATLGPRLGKDVQHVIKAHKAGDWTNVDGDVSSAAACSSTASTGCELVASDDRAAAASPTGPGWSPSTSTVTARTRAGGQPPAT